ncbi:uncharacterized protein LOC128986962 [Macrosteles quadrilineatus]|uniref:uncharacterized protein LOC128986962 n=1 Tax=Macrosteles quadrilineatus TaxID=74068 RepID=UPI0023E13A34|nr:uncharacterized protein LOC128986962 [Macrosteles quadrilineatus]
MASTHRLPLSICGNQTSQTDEIEERCTKMANTFVSMMDNYLGWAPHELHEDAVMDWFGRFVRGRSSIINFLRSHVSQTQHVIESVSKIPPVTHRLIKVTDVRKARRVKKFSTERRENLAEECGQGDCKGLSTPENTVFPNLKAMVNAPPRAKQPAGTDCAQCEFLEIRGKFNCESVDSLFGRRGEKLERIILAYTDQIHLIIYEAKNTCRKKLFS